MEAPARSESVPSLGGGRLWELVFFFQVVFDLDMWEGDRSRLRHAARAVFLAVAIFLFSHFVGGGLLI